MFLILKNKIIMILCAAVAMSLLQGCVSRQQAETSLNRALQEELAHNQSQFLNQPIADVLAAFQRRPTSISILDKKNNVVWLYDIYDSLIDPQTGRQVNRPNQLSFIEHKVHWKEYYYANSDGIVYDVKIEGETF
jgi:outer membrane murein-binding lipoprotein Lpp